MHIKAKSSTAPQKPARFSGFCTTRSPMFQVWSQIQGGNWYFWVGRWWGKSKVYFPQNNLTTWQFTSNKSPQQASSICYSEITQIQNFEIFFCLICLEVGWGRREREVPKILRGLGVASSEFIDFTTWRRRLFLYKRYSLAPFLTTTLPMEENCHKRQTFNQSGGAMEIR